MNAIVIPVGPGDHNEQLRYTMRCLDVNYPDHGEIWVIGYKPSWLINVNHIAGNPVVGRPHINVYRNILIAAEHPDVPEEFIAFNDDFFITEPVDEIPVCYKERLAVQVERAARGRSRNSWWNQSLAFTLKCLRDHGYDDPLSYEIHQPLPVDKAGMAKALRMFVDVGDGAGDPPQWRTLYGVINDIGGTQRPDCKARGSQRRDISTPFFSTDESSWRIYGRHFAKAYPYPSPYEKTYGRQAAVAVKPNTQSNEAELAWLEDKARQVPAGQACVELGVYQGGSLSRIAVGARAGNNPAVIGVDAWDRRVYVSRPQWNKHYGHTGHKRVAAAVVPQATLIRALSLDAAKTYNGPQIGLLYIDADHDYPSAMQDLRAWRPHLADGAWIAFDDYYPRFPGVIRCVDELVAEGDIQPIEILGGKMAVTQLATNGAEAVYQPQGELDTLFYKYGTDKGSFHQPHRAVHNYHRAYEELFADRKNDVAAMLEVGIGSPNSRDYCMAPHYEPGGSLRAWADYFVNAHIWGLDMTSTVGFTHDRITAVLADSRDHDQVDAALPADVLFDIVIDDGDHEPDAQIATLGNLWGRVKPGGIYVIEDLIRKNTVIERASALTGTPWSKKPNTLAATIKEM